MARIHESPRQEQPIRVLWLIDSLAMGGAESLVLPFLRGIDRTRFEPSLCCLNTIGGNPLEDEVRREGVTVTNLGARSLRDLAAFRRLMRLIRSSRHDLIHAHLTYASIWGALASSLSGVPMLATLHVAPPRGLTRETLRDRLLRFSLQRRATAVIAVSAALRGLYTAGGGLDPSKLIVIHNGIDLRPFDLDRSAERLRLRQELGLSASSKIATTVSVLRRAKGVDSLIDAAALLGSSHPDTCFVVIGDGPMRQEWEQRARHAGLGSRIRWTGFRRDIPEILAGSDLFILPSLEDAFPTVLLEAMAASLPVVATAVGGIVEIVKQGSTGTLVAAASPADLARAVGELLDDAPKRAAMGAAAREAVEQQFSIEQWVGRLSELYEDVAERRERAA